MKSFLLSFMAAFFATGLMAQTYDTVYSQVIGPGIVHTKIETNDPLKIDVLEIDLSNPYNHMETVCSNDRIPDGTRETTSNMANRISTDGHKVVGAINGDFFSYVPGSPIGMQVRNSQIIKSYGGSHGISFDVNDKPVVGKPQLQGSVTANGKQTTLSQVNLNDDDLQWFPQFESNRLVLYNGYYSKNINLTDGETKAILEPVSHWSVNDEPVRLKVTEITNDDVTIPEGKVVLYGLGNGADFINNNMQVNDEIEIKLEIYDIYSTYGIEQPKKLVQHIGGYPRFIVYGKDYVDAGAAELNANIDKSGRQPRTAIGFSQDSARMYFVTVDGRQSSYSIGMSMYDLAEFMIGLGVYTGINMDSGGSTTMVINDTVTNSPSDGSERAVINSLMTVSTAPDDLLTIHPRKAKVYVDKSIDFKFNIWNPAERVDTSLIVYSVDEGLGTIDNTGAYNAASTPVSGYVYVNYKDKRDSAFIVVKKRVDSVSVLPATTVTDDRNPINFQALWYDSEGFEVELEQDEVTWELTNTSVGSITDAGVFNGETTGETDINASAYGLTGTAKVSVEIGDEFELLDNMETPSRWIVTNENMTNINLSVVTDEHLTEGSGALKVDYEFTFNNKVPSFTLNQDIRVFGLPDSIWADVKTNGKYHRVVFFTKKENNDLIVLANDFNRTPWKKYITEKLDLPMKEHPITFTGLKVELMKSDYTLGESYNGYILIDNLRVSYPDHTPPVTVFDIPENKGTVKCYASPLDKTVTLIIDLNNGQHQVEASLYNVQGQKVKRLTQGYIRLNGKMKHEVSVSDMNEGIYIFKVLVDGKPYADKIIIY